MKDHIELRGHHLFCSNIIDLKEDLIYNPKFCENFRKYQEKMSTQPDLTIRIVETCGDTCLYCPSWIEKDHKCMLYDYTPGGNWIDLHILEALGWNIGDERTVRELRHRISEAFLNLPEMCYIACPFQDLLKCVQGLERLKQEVKNITS